MLITNLGKGGAQRVFYDHATAFSKFATINEVVYNLSHDSRVYDSGLPIKELKISKFWSILGPFGRLIGRSIALNYLVKNGDFDLVISHMDGANWVNVLSFSIAAKILVVHGTVVHDKNVPALIQWLRIKIIFPWLYNCANYTVCVSEGIKHELSCIGRVRRAIAIPNFFDVESIIEKSKIPIPKKWESLFEKNTILMTSGRLSDQKKQSYLIDILTLLRKQGSSAKLVILGDGELRDDLVKKCSSHNLSSWVSWEINSNFESAIDADVYFLGYVSNPYQYLRHASLFLFPSAWEGFPMALCEAMICGTPIVSTDCPTGPREILAPGSIRDEYDLRVAEFAECGVLMPIISSTADIEVWVKTVQNLLSDVQARERMSVSASQSIKSLDRSVVLCQWQLLIKNTMYV